MVGDDYQRQGLAGELMTRLAHAAAARGVKRFRATMLADNIAIQRVTAKLAAGPLKRRQLGSLSEVEIELPRRATTATPIRNCDGPRGSSACDHRGVRWKLTVRAGPKVTRSTFPAVAEALDELEAPPTRAGPHGPIEVVDAKGQAL